ncbi:L-rhamnose/proton symporter RhaT [Flavilitoribacter nigricans]|uniref:Rhamnose/proton symporter RhaT n=1 Tax=Flavilitoribacter nigricans (strain ATCC 23147 / DSM 23189 / NBRC 102662 / NCIMB 1420 / SS-2) TaxID=1122177 RepID=A0A2D0N2X7_FLAN2|nr:L-rhamnose/proton symporter RhaT [Flavilitoribacter nigricans]PHN02736.1 rhamnose/proton symporter RhaT [Flavilitoribacter nigricans DSM 23189 = NBRC 102662]
MIAGVAWAVLAGLMLGLYALPEKFTRDFKFENTWSLFFMLTMFVVPIIASVLLIDGFGAVFRSVPTEILLKMGAAGFLWGIGVMMWGKAINHIGLSLGFSLFIGTVILIGSLLPFFVDGLPGTRAFTVIMAGILVVLLGVIANGRAGLIREQDEKKTDTTEQKGSVLTGILIAVIGGLLATGFSYANAVGRPVLHEASQSAGNPDWVTAVAVMFPIFISGGIVMLLYFGWELNRKQAWADFRTPHFGKNFWLILIMAVFHYAASALFAYAAFRLGSAGNTVGYAIFNTASVATAIISGLVTGEWVKASPKARNSLYFGLLCMVVGIIIVAIGNGLTA